MNKILAPELYVPQLYTAICNFYFEGVVGITAPDFLQHKKNFALFSRILYCFVNEIFIGR